MQILRRIGYLIMHQHLIITYQKITNKLKKITIDLDTTGKYLLQDGREVSRPKETRNIKI